ncbi:MAG: DNA repair protein RadC [Methanobacteriota archaeon]
MKIKDIPWYNRPGIRLKRKGAYSLSDAELLAIVLGRGDQNENAIDLSNRVLAENNFDRLAELSLPELEKQFHNTVKAMKINAMFEIFRRTNKLAKHGFTKKIETAEDVYNYFVDGLKEKKKEYFYALFLDTKNRIIQEELVSVGILDASLIHPREVFSAAIRANAKSILLVHNHPSGECEPSINDKEVTKMLTDAGELLGISVLDHVIIGKEGFCSMKEKGMGE